MLVAVTVEVGSERRASGEATDARSKRYPLHRGTRQLDDVNHARVRQRPAPTGESMVEAGD